MSAEGDFSSTKLSAEEKVGDSQRVKISDFAFYFFESQVSLLPKHASVFIGADITDIFQPLLEIEADKYKIKFLVN